ncbi:hypothetical protein [Burkholderia sp. MSMB1078WGS]|uniref:hypothetical protein n=1 Tax=Burkholderia sp. MSMB1078WGS TaxID=1637900 RepID=UPI0015CFE0C1|nr:hypothetical protein [Burkholderia sp. MSMB1078WGS]
MHLLLKGSWLRFPRVASPVRWKRRRPLRGDASRRIARSHRFRTRGSRAAFVVLIAGSVGTRRIAVLAWTTIATAGIDASGIVGAYSESGQTRRLHLHHSIFAIMENGGLRQERETSTCIIARGLRVYPVRKPRDRPAFGLYFREKDYLNPLWQSIYPLGKRF